MKINWQLLLQLFLAIYNVKTGQFEYTNAGHNPPIVISQDGKNRFLVSPGDLFLGINPKHVYRESEDHLEIGDTLVFYTDGVTEATDQDDKLYGEERFIEKLIVNVLSPIESMLEKVVEDLAVFQGDDQADDITMLLLRRNT